MQPYLDSASRRALKKRAHQLKPIVRSGAAGLTRAVTAEIDRALWDHELVKIRLACATRGDRHDEITALCDELAAAFVQQIGHTATLYRPRPEAT